MADVKCLLKDTRASAPTLVSLFYRYNNQRFVYSRREIVLATGDKHDKLQAQIERLEAELLAALEKKERALSMAQQIKRGHVYIISNIGSFGENVYKIGYDAPT